jgi:hypothetical protein
LTSNLMKRDLLSPQPNEVSSPRQRHPVFLTHPPSSQKHKTQSTTAGQSQDRKNKTTKGGKTRMSTDILRNFSSVA